MGILASFKTFWALNSTLNNAIPSSKLFLDYVPPGTAYPYVRVSVLGTIKEPTTGTNHIKRMTYQLGIFHTNLDTLSSLVDTIDGVLDNKSITSGTLINTLRNKLISGEVIDGVYTYQCVLEYDWSYNSSAGA